MRHLPSRLSHVNKRRCLHKKWTTLVNTLLKRAYSIPWPEVETSKWHTYKLYEFIKNEPLFTILQTVQQNGSCNIGHTMNSRTPHISLEWAMGVFCEYFGNKCPRSIEGVAGWNMVTSSNGNIFRVTSPSCGRNSPVTGEFPSQRPVTRSFDIFFDLFLNKRLRKQSRRRWFEIPSSSLWRHCNDLKPQPILNSWREEPVWK